MPQTVIDELLIRAQEVQRELEAEFDRRLAETQERFHYTVHRGRVRFEREVRRLQRRYRTSVLRYLAEARIGHILSAPVIYSIFLPMFLLDLTVTVYQHVCFRLYHIPLVPRRDYFALDRHQLGYLNMIEQFNCLYCGYGNGLIEYVREITSRTEQYWCPIKHARRTPDPHKRVQKFLDFGDAEAYRNHVEALRNDWEDIHQESRTPIQKD